MLLNYSQNSGLRGLFFPVNRLKAGQNCFVKAQFAIQWLSDQNFSPVAELAPISQFIQISWIGNGQTSLPDAAQCQNRKAAVQSCSKGDGSVCAQGHTAVFRCDVVSVHCHTSREGAVQQRQPRVLSYVQRCCKT